MPGSVSDALADQGRAAEAKIADLRSPGRYLVSSMLAGAYIGVAVLICAVAGPPLSASSPLTKLVQGCVFGIALTLVVFGGAELSTGNMMTAIQGMFTGRRAVLAASG